jgi:hypothetical protein
VTPADLAPVEASADVAAQPLTGTAQPAAEPTAGTAVQPVAQPAAQPVAQRGPSVSTSEVRGAPGEAGSITITVTVPVPPASAPVLVHPDLGPLEEQLALAARSLQGAIEAVPERPGE